jgi:hypothetical protein
VGWSLQALFPPPLLRSRWKIGGGVSMDTRCPPNTPTKFCDEEWVLENGDKTEQLWEPLNKSFSRCTDIPLP